MAGTDKTQQMSENMAANKSKSDLIEKIVFAAIPILFSCIVYLMTTLSNANNEITILKSRIAVVVTQDNRAISPQSATIEMAQIREQLTHRIDQLERDIAVAGGNMILDHERGMAMVAASLAAMTTNSAIARSDIVQRLSIIENNFKNLEDRLNAR